MTIQTTKIKNGTVILPKQLQKDWKEAEVYIFTSKDYISIKRMQAPSGLQMLKEFRKVGQNISKKDVGKAIEWARGK